MDTTRIIVSHRQRGRVRSWLLVLSLAFGAACCWSGIQVGRREVAAAAVPVVDANCPPRFYTTLERQRIMRDLGFYHGKIDGLRGPLTIAAEKQYAEWYNSQMAAKTWPPQQPK